MVATTNSKFGRIEEALSAKIRHVVAPAEGITSTTKLESFTSFRHGGQKDSIVVMESQLLVVGCTPPFVVSSAEFFIHALISLILTDSAVFPSKVIRCLDVFRSELNAAFQVVDKTHNGGVVSWNSKTFGYIQMRCLKVLPDFCNSSNLDDIDGLKVVIVDKIQVMYYVGMGIKKQSRVFHPGDKGSMDLNFYTISTCEMVYSSSLAAIMACLAPRFAEAIRLSRNYKSVVLRMNIETALLGPVEIVERKGSFPINRMLKWYNTHLAANFDAFVAVLNTNIPAAIFNVTCMTSLILILKVLEGLKAMYGIPLFWKIAESDWVRGPTLMKCNVDNSKATFAMSRPDGWLKTCDICYVDDDDGQMIVFCDLLDVGVANILFASQGSFKLDFEPNHGLIFNDDDESILTELDTVETPKVLEEWFKNHTGSLRDGSSCDRGVGVESSHEITIHVNKPLRQEDRATTTSFTRHVYDPGIQAMIAKFYRASPPTIMFFSQLEWDPGTLRVRFFEGDRIITKRREIGANFRYDINGAELSGSGLSKRLLSQLKSP